MNLLVTGGAGFIGSNFIRYILKKYPSYHIINYDKLTYAGNLDNLKDIEDNANYKFIKGDICDLELVQKLSKDVDVIINFAAESHNDRSITNPFDFIETDVRGTYTLIQAARDAAHERYIQISTDEVYGDQIAGVNVDENAPLKPSSPYSASKAGGDLQVLAAHRTFNFPGIITRCTNNYGPYHYPEKLFPLFITNALENKKLPIYGDGGQIRDWLFVDDHCSAIDLILHEGGAGEVYNISAGQDPEITNLDFTKRLLAILEKDESLIEYVKDRPGHDLRYGLDSSKIRAIGWKPLVKFEEGLKLTVNWYKENEEWWKKIKSGEYMEWYKKQYGR